MSKLLILLAFILGGLITHLDMHNATYLVGISVIAFAALKMRVSYRNNNTFGMFFTSPEAHSYAFTKNEKHVSVFFLSLLASPVIYMVLVFSYGQISL